MGGNTNDYRQWAKQLAGIDEAYVWPLRGGLGSVHIAALHTGNVQRVVLNSPAAFARLVATLCTGAALKPARRALLLSVQAPFDPLAF